MIGGGLTIFVCLCVLVTAKPAIDKRAKEEITFGNQQNGIKVKRADLSLPSNEDQQGSIEAESAHSLDGESQSDDVDAKGLLDEARAKEVVKLLKSAKPVDVEGVSSSDSEPSEPSESAMSYEGNDGGDDAGDDVTDGVIDDFELDTSDDDDAADSDSNGGSDTQPDTLDADDNEDSTSNLESESRSDEDDSKDALRNKQLLDAAISDANLDPEILRRYYDNYLQKLYYKSNAYPYIMRYLYRRRRATLPRPLKATKRSKRIKRDLYYPAFDDIELARRLLERNGLYYGDDDLSKNDADIDEYNQLYGGDNPSLSTLDTDFERPEDVEYIPYNYQYGDIPYQEEPSYLVENKRDLPLLGMLPGERRKKNTFFPVFEEPRTHWGEFVSRKRSQLDGYERLLRLAEALSDNSPYQYIDEYDYYRRKK